MAMQDRARYKPDMQRSTLEALVANLDPTATPPTGTVYLPVQVITYDDGDIPAYRPGDPEIEQYVTVLHEDTLSFALDGFGGLTAAGVLAQMEGRLDSWAATVKPAVPMLRRIIRAAKRTAPRAL